MTKRSPLAALALGAALALALALSVAGPASAGGWAVTTLDPLPAVEAGAPTVVTFTIRQHGVTPVWPEGDGVALVVTGPDGRAVTFPATPAESAGRYRATVTLPAAGTYHWVVQQGWFAEQDLGPLTVAAPTTAAPLAAGAAGGATASGATGHRGSPAVRLALPVAAVVLGALTVLSLVDGRRRQHAAPAPATPVA